MDRTKICSHFLLLALFSMLLVGVGGRDAAALTLYTDVAGTNVSFTSIQEASSSGDAEPLFDQPVLGLSNQLLFAPTTFSASASGVGGFDSTGSQLQLQISANGPLDTIQMIRISDFGDAELAGVGTATTGTFVGMSGSVTVTETTSGPIAPVVISFADFAADFAPTFTPAQTLLLPGDSGVTIWTGTVEIDVAAFVPNATVATLSFDNDLFASSEVGTNAFIQKTGVAIEVIPEPGTFTLLGAGLLLMGHRARSRRQ